MCGFPDIGVEEFDFVASEFLDACASDGGLGLCEEFDDGAVDELDASFGDFAFDEFVEWFGGEECAEVCVHSFGLVE